MAIEVNRRYLTHFTNRVNEFGEIFAVPGGLIERVETSIGKSFRQNYPARQRAVLENKFVPLNRRDLIVEPRD